MAKQLNVSLAFTADTSQAKNAIQSLVNDLNKLSSTTGLDKDLPITKEIMEAQVAAKQLGETLKSSFNTDSGKLDLTKFTQQLKSSGMSLSEYGNKLSLLGTQGDQAFLKIAQSIAKTQTPLRQSSKLLTEFATTLKNTARWQISSSILHGFMGAVQSAYGYAQNLDKSLNNIRIVTGQNAEQMAIFAEQANKAAKALSTTTTEYTNASLIYYQQGLSDDEVAKRTEITVKMANAAGQSAEVVSDQLTAVWNNFYDGSKSLEYYADVMTALGAATASSTDEIAGGLEKFAAIGDTIGLSYEYAASALATITSNTRQSEEVVGTALKTIFARIQGLNLGETLDDGTTLNKYSKALESVGISIFDSAGEVKKMDIILDEMAAKWDTLSKAQQAALAQTVAGTRQYTQLVALMDNWDNGDSDSMTANLETSYGATGALQEQADIYAESWEASRDRVTASLETIYNSLIDEEFFISLNDTFSKLLNGVSSIIDAMGGLKGVVSLAGMLLLKYFGSDLTQGINNALSNFRIFTGAAQEDMATLKKEAYDAAMAMTEGLSDSPGIQSLRESLKNTYTLQNDLTNAVKKMSPEQRAVAEEALKTAQYYNDIAVEAGLAAEKAEELYINSLKASQVTRNNTMNTMQQHYDNSVGQAGSELLASARGMKSSAADLGIDTSGLDAAIKKYSSALHDDSIDKESEAFKKIAETLRQELDAVAAKAEESSSRFKAFEDALRGSAEKVVSSQKEFEELKAELSTSGKSGKEFADGVEKAAKAAKDAGGKVDTLESKLKNYRKLLDDGKQGTEEFKKAEEDLRRELDITHVSTEQATQQTAKLANTTADGRTKVKVLTDEQIKLADAARQSAMANANTGEAIKTAGEKSAQATAKIKYTALAYQSIGSALTGTLSAISSFAMGLNSLKSIYDTLNNTELSTFEKTTQIMMSLSMAIPALMSGLKGVGNAFHFVFSAQKKGLTGQIAYLLGAKQVIATDKLLVIGKNGEVLARGKAGDAAVVEALKTEGATTVTKLDTAATWANIAAKMVKYWYIGVIIVAIGILIGVVYNLVKAYNAEADAAKRAAEQAEVMKKAYEETKQAAEDLQSTIDKYKNARNSMSGLQKDTLEYKQALMEANEQALLLLETYEGIAAYTTRGEDGLIVISDKGFEEILNQQYAKLDQAQRDQLSSQLKASKAQEKSDIVNFARRQNTTYEAANEALNSIAQYFQENNITDLIPDDVAKLTNLTDAQRESILSNIDGYSKMANTLISTNKAQEVLTDAYIDAAWRLNNPDAETGEDGRYSDEDIVAKSRFTTYQNKYYLSEEEQAAALSNYQQKHAQENLDMFTPLGQALVMSGGYYNPYAMTGSDAAYYAHLMGYDMDGWSQTESGIWDGGGKAWKKEGGFLGIGSEWAFTSGGVSKGTLTDDELAQAIADKENEILQAELAKIEAPEILSNVNQVLDGLSNNKNLANLMYSASMDEDGKGQFTMANYQMSQKEAQTWLDNWDQITAQFEGKMSDTGFWEKMGFESGDAFLTSLNTWLTNRSKQNDASAFNSDGGIATEDLKKTSDTIKTKTEDGTLTSATADTDASYQNMLIYAKDLLQIYPELTDAANTFANTGLIGTQEWIAAYDTIAAKINELDAMAQAAPKLESLKEKTGKDYTQFFEEELNSEEQKIFVQVDINKYQSEAAIQAEIARLQSVADANKIKVKMTAIESAQSGLKEDMGTDDWVNMRDNTLNWGQDGIIEFNQFLNMTYEQQQAYLTQLSEQTQSDLLANKTAALQALQTALTGITDPTEQAAIQTEIDLLTSEIAIYEKLSAAGLQAATSLGELYAIMGEMLTNGENVSFEDYANQLIVLGEQFDNCTAEVGRFKEALESGNSTQIENTRNMLEAGIRAGELAEQYGFGAEELERYAEQLGLQEKYSDMSKKALVELAKDQKRYDRAVESASENMEDWNDALKTFKKGGIIASDTLDEMAECYGDLIDVDGSSLSAEFLTSTENLEDMKKALEGDEEAYQRLQAAAGKDILAQVGIDTSQYEADLATLMGMAATVEGEGLADVEAGASLDNAGFLQALTDMVNAAGMTAQQATDYLSSMGVDAEVVEEETTTPEPQTYMGAVPTVTSVTASGTNPITGMPQTYSFPSVTYTESPMVTEGEKTSVATSLKVTSANKSSGGGMKHTTNQNTGGKKSSGGGGGGGGKSKKTSESRGKKTDIVDRYKQVDDKLDDVKDKMDDASKAADRLWGAARIKQMQNINRELQNEIGLLKDKKKEADKYLIEDEKSLHSAGNPFGLNFNIVNGNIANYESEMSKVYAQREALLDSFGQTMDNNETERLAEFDKQVEELKAAISQYDETRELSEDLANEIQDKIYEWQDNNYEQLNYKLEVELDINDAEMELLDYYLEKIEGNIYKTAEAFTKMKEITDVYNDNLSNQAQYVTDLENAYYAGEISLDAYKEGLKESQSATIENLQALQEQKEAMQDYYGEVMDLALEEIALYTDGMEELNSVLDHYSNILELVGKQEDYATKGKVLQSKAANLRNEMQVQQKLYEESNAEAEKWAEKMANAVEGSNEYETYKKNWIAAQEAANEAQDNMLSKTEEWAEAMKAVVENELADLAHTMEESLTGGTSFDELLTSMERRSSLQEEYLTTTNQIYETNKLMRQAQQEIDKTTNSAAKRRLQGFINETAHMQDQNKLSQYELDIQQAKYDLLLAEIALEEAQNAKSTVRLQRDSEGNFGYVYTADSSAVAEAEQELADKQNALYNLGLEGANDYSQKYAETMQEAQDAITELTEMWMNGEIESEEEFQRRKAEIQDYYYEKLKQYSNLYQVALTTDSNVIKDAWSSDFNDMIYKTDEWKGAVDEYFVGAAESMQTWAEVCATVLSESGLDDISTKVGEIDQKSQDLKTTLIGEDGESGVVGAMMSEVEAAGKLSEAYIGIQNEIDKLIEKYEELLEKVNEDYTNPDTEVVDPAIDPDEEEDPTPPTPDPDPPAGPTWDRVKAAYDRINAGKWGNGINNRIQNGKNEGFTEEEVRLGQKLINKVYGGMSLSAAKKALGFDTGGYTGDWAGSYGKLAFLHQKELVLNQGDTENFLASMEVLERILQMIDLQSASSQIGGLLNSPSIGSANSEPLEQNVHIEASFPNVSDRNEIEEAFSNLINLASQYAYRD